MKNPLRFFAFAFALALYTLQAPALELEGDVFFRHVAPHQAALMLDGRLAAIVEVVHVDQHKIKVRFDGRGGENIHDWIQSSLTVNHQRKSGQIVTADFNRKVKHVREFKDALLTEIGLPAGDGASKDAAYINLEFAPWIVRDKKGGDDENHIDFGDVAGWQKVRYKAVPCMDPDCLR